MLFYFVFNYYYYLSAETPIIVHLTPLLGALIGVVVSLVLVLLAVLLALRLRGRNYEDKNSNDAVKGSSESADSLDKNPDIIPHNNGKKKILQ